MSSLRCCFDREWYCPGLFPPAPIIQCGGGPYDAEDELDYSMNLILQQEEQEDARLRQSAEDIMNHTVPDHRARKLLSSCHPRDGNSNPAPKEDAPRQCGRFPYQVARHLAKHRREARPPPVDYTPLNDSLSTHKENLLPQPSQKAREAIKSRHGRRSRLLSAARGVPSLITAEIMVPPPVGLHHSPIRKSDGSSTVVSEPSASRTVASLVQGSPSSVYSPSMAANLSSRPLPLLTPEKCNPDDEDSSVASSLPPPPPPPIEPSSGMDQPSTTPKSVLPDLAATTPDSDSTDESSLQEESEEEEESSKNEIEYQPMPGNDCPAEIQPFNLELSDVASTDFNSTSPGRLAMDALLTAHVHSGQTPAIVIRTLKDLARILHDDPPVRTDVLFSGGHLVLVQIMKASGDNVDVLVACLLALMNLSLLSQARAMIAEVGAIRVMVDAMNNHRKHVVLQILCCGTLAELVSTASPKDQRYAKANAALLIEAGGHLSMIEAMKTFSPNERLQRYACLALKKLSHTCYRRSLVEAGAVSALALAMEVHPSNAVTDYARAALVALLQPAN